MTADTVTITPKYVVEEIPKEEIPKREIIVLGREKFVDMAGQERFEYTKTTKLVDDKERHFMVYNMKGSVLHVRGIGELTRLGYRIGQGPLIEEDSISGEAREINVATLLRARNNVKNQTKALRRAVQNNANQEAS